MINLEDVKEIIVYSGVADLRKGISGLSALVGDVSEGTLYMFSNRHRNLLKGLYRDKYGVSLCCCRLNQGNYHWPERPCGSAILKQGELIYLLEGHDVNMLIRRITLSGQSAEN